MRKLIIGVTIFLSLLSYFKEDIKTAINNVNSIPVLNVEKILSTLK